jgi:8-oxo-dGTP diphosphatase
VRRVLIGSGVVCDGRGHVLLVLRAEPPEQHLWSVPGGRRELGETLEGAVAREVKEETGLIVTVGRELGTLDILARSDEIYEIHDFAATPTGGRLAAGDDAAEVRWASRADIAQIAVTANLLNILDSYGVFRSA